MNLTPGRSLAAGLLCLSLAAWWAPGRTTDGWGSDATERPLSAEGALQAPMEPVARALVPLGPLRAVASSVLWMVLQRKQQEGDAEAVADLAEGLLVLHPDLAEVRVFLARQLVVSQAPRSPDDGRHRALVTRGLHMLEEGFERADSERLHGALGTLLTLQMDMDPRFPPVAAQYFGERPEDVAIAELRRASAGGTNALNLILLLVDRGLTTLRLGGDPVDAARDLEEATGVLQQFGEDDRMVIAPELEELRQQLDASGYEAAGNRS
jgi:hypothetical protein